MNKQIKNTKRSNTAKLDSVYFMKMVLYFLAGAFWVHAAFGNTVIPIPIGLGLGLWFASHEHFRIDRKIEYAVLIVAMFITYFLAPKILLQF
jgi:succinate dehydrogenase/fumarate reductase cytochrome b subunit